jgi:hypothetical protein
MKVLEVPHLVRDISWLLLGPSTHPTAGLQRKELRDVAEVTWLRHITPKRPHHHQDRNRDMLHGTGSSPPYSPPCIPTPISPTLFLAYGVALAQAKVC